MNRRNPALSFLLAVALLIAFSGSIAAAPSPGGSVVFDRFTTASTWKAETEECKFLGLINDYRKQNNLGTLTISLTLAAAAEHHSIDMAKNNYFSHTLSDGSTWSENIAAHGYPTDTSRAENIAAGRSSAAEVFEQWRNSSGHNANMLNAKFNAIGIGRYALDGSKYTYYWTNTFGSRVDQAFSCSGGSTGGGEAPGTQLTITGGGRTSSSTPSTRAYDGDLTTAWYTTTTSKPSAAYIYFDLGVTKSIGKVKWYFSKSGYCDSLKVQISTDKSKWTTLTTRTSSKAGSWYSLTTSSKARYVRFYVSNPNGDAVLGYIAEVQIFA